MVNFLCINHSPRTPPFFSSLRLQYKWAESSYRSELKNGFGIKMYKNIKI